MRGAPHVGFSATMRKISSRTSVDSCFPPPCFLTFEIKLPVQVKPGVPAPRRACQSGCVLVWAADASVQPIAGAVPNFPEVAFDGNESNRLTVLSSAGRSSTYTIVIVNLGLRKVCKNC